MKRDPHRDPDWTDYLDEIREPRMCAGWWILPMLFFALGLIACGLFALWAAA